MPWEGRGGCFEVDSLEQSSANSRDPALPTPGTRTSMSEKAHRGREVQRASGRGSLSLPRGQEPSSLPEAPLELGLRGRSTWQHWSLCLSLELMSYIPSIVSCPLYPAWFMCECTGKFQFVSFFSSLPKIA